MKNKLFRITVPIVALCAFVGTGFGTWYFVSESSNEKSLKASIRVTSLNEDPEFGHFQIYLKNERFGDKKFAYYNNAYPNLIFDQNEGIYWSNTPKDDYTAYVNTMTIRFYVKDGYINEVNPELFKVSIDYTFPQAFTDLGYFIRKSPNDEELTFKDKSMDSRHYYQTADDSTNMEKEHGFVYYVYELPKYIYAPGREPKNEEELNTMKAELLKVKDQITVTVTVTYDNQVV